MARRRKGRDARQNLFAVPVEVDAFPDRQQVLAGLPEEAGARWVVGRDFCVVGPVVEIRLADEVLRVREVEGAPIPDQATAVVDMGMALTRN